MNTEKDGLDPEFDRISKAIAAGDEVTLLAMDYMAALERPVPARIHRKWMEFAFKTASECGELRGVVARLRSEIAALRESRDAKAIESVVRYLRGEGAGEVGYSTVSPELRLEAIRDALAARGLWTFDAEIGDHDPDARESRGLNGEENAHGG